MIKMMLGLAAIVFLTMCAGSEATPSAPPEATPSPPSEATPSAPSESDWIDELVATMQSAPVGNPPQAIYRYDYRGQTVYYVPPQCCDQFSTLYDASGEIICAPDGGKTGRGDRKCTDFFEQRTNELLVWRDSRPK